MPHRLFRVPSTLFARLPSLVPGCCALCGDDRRGPLCEECDARFFATRPPRCVRCASRLADGSGQPRTCGACLHRPPAFDATIVATDYAAPADQLVLALKFGNRLALAPLFGQLMQRAWRQADGEQPALLTAVPLGPQRLRERGFNQALEIARPIARALGMRLEPALLRRMHDTRAQSMLHPDERHRNVRNAFGVPGALVDVLRGAHVGVVDDVITTGETLDEAARTLKRFGAARVTNLVFARTPQK